MALDISTSSMMDVEVFETSTTAYFSSWVPPSKEYQINFPGNFQRVSVRIATYLDGYGRNFGCG